jgi:D-serine deaminase-like pyridoxal phosphate-dependent protein
MNRGPQSGATWESLASMTPEEIRAKGLLPAGFLPLPHVKQATGGQVFPENEIREISAQEGRDLRRFDVDSTYPTSSRRSSRYAFFSPSMLVTRCGIVLTLALAALAFSAPREAAASEGCAAVRVDHRQRSGHQVAELCDGRPSGCDHASGDGQGSSGATDRLRSLSGPM